VADLLAQSCGRYRHRPARPGLSGENPAKQTRPLAHAEALIRLALPSCTMTGQRVARDAAT
jgi:hypothetical protein